MRLSETVICREVEGAFLLYDRANDRIFGLNRTGTRTWQLVQVGTPIERIGAILANEFQAKPTACDQDVMRFMEKLRAHDLLVPGA